MDTTLSHLLMVLATIIVCWVVIAYRNVRMVRSFQLIQGAWSNLGLTGARPHEIKAAINAMRANKIEPMKFWIVELKRGTFLVPDSGADMKFLVKVDGGKR